MIQKILKNKFFKVAILLITLIAFIVYYYFNQSLFSRIGDVSWWQVALIVLGQSIVIISNILLMIIFGLFVHKKISLKDSAKITAYSSLVNFFGFLQGGLAVRAVYLKQTASMPYKTYFGLTIVQYLLIFGVSGLMILIGFVLFNSLAVALYLVLAFVVASSVLVLVAKYSRSKRVLSMLDTLKKTTTQLQPNLIFLTLCAVILQLFGSTLASAVELYAIGAEVTVSGLLIYSGLAQFAIVVAITPGAIGIREGILLIAQDQMRLSTDDIVLAATIDRAVYFITLALFTPLALSARLLAKRLPLTKK